MIRQFYNVTHGDYNLGNHFRCFEFNTILFVHPHRFQTCLIAYKCFVVQRVLSNKIFHDRYRFQ